MLRSVIKFDRGTVDEILSSLRKTSSHSFSQPSARGFSFMASFDKAAFEKKAFKFVPYLILGKIIFAAWFISYLVKL